MEFSFITSDINTKIKISYSSNIRSLFTQFNRVLEEHLVKLGAFTEHRDVLKNLNVNLFYYSTIINSVQFLDQVGSEITREEVVSAISADPHELTGKKLVKPAPYKKMDIFNQ